MLQRPDAMFIEEIQATVNPSASKSWHDKTRNAFADFGPATSAGVIGVDCTCDHRVALPAMQISDFLIADCVELPTAR